MSGRGLGFLKRPNNNKVSPAGLDSVHESSREVVSTDSLEALTKLNTGRPASAPRADRGSARDVVTPVSRLGAAGRRREAAAAEREAG